MGQTTSSSSAATSSALSSSDTPSLPSDYGSAAAYSHASATNFASNHQTNEDVATTLPSDGYRWRKYGQKSVKGSAYARNYYKCTYPGCTVKKQVDKINNNGKIVDQVLCKGEHCHGPPQITRINAHDQQTFRNSVINESLAHTEIMVKHEDTPRFPFSGHPGLRGSGGVNRSRSSNSNGSSNQIANTLPVIYQLPTISYDSQQQLNPTSGLLLPYNTQSNTTDTLNVPFVPSHHISIPNSKKNSSNSTDSKPTDASSTKSTTESDNKSTNNNNTNTSNNNNNPNSTLSTRHMNDSARTDTSDNSDSSTENASPNNVNGPNSTTNSPSSTNNTSPDNTTALVTTNNGNRTPSTTTNNANNTSPNNPTLVAASSVTTVSSPRLVIETNTSVDCLDDGYHWRKYGQKTVKGSPFPRSYYKCTEKGCLVKKQVEQNGTSIVNTYEGTHTHIAPAMDDHSDLIKKRRLRRSEGQELGAPFKRMHKSLDDIPADSKSGSSSPSDATQVSNSPHFHTPMPIGSMGSILHHTSHLHSSINLSLGPPMTYNSEPHSFTALSSLGASKVRVDSTPALAPLHSFSHTTDSATSPPNFVPAPQNSASAPTTEQQ